MVFVFYSCLLKEYTLNTVAMKTKWLCVSESLFIELRNILYTVRGQKSFCTNIFPYIFHKTTYYQKHDVVSSVSIMARCTALCDKVCQWFATGRWFPPRPAVSSTNKTDRHDITEILLKVALNTNNLIPKDVLMGLVLVLRIYKLIRF